MTCLLTKHRKINIEKIKKKIKLYYLYMAREDLSFILTILQHYICGSL